MRKKFFRFLLDKFKKWENIETYKYVNNLRIFKTRNVIFVIVNSLLRRKVLVYYFYMPESLYLHYDTIDIDSTKNHHLVFNFIRSEVKKIEEDEIYRRYRIFRREPFSTESEE